MQENGNIKDSTLDSTGGDQYRTLNDKKDIWDIIGILGRFLGSVVAASAMVFVAIIGMKVDDRTADWDQFFRTQELNARKLELQSSRESAANQLRGSVFSSVGEHVAPLLSKDDEKLALLAGLHTNFGALYDTRPVFAAFSRDITGVGSRQELKRLAKRAARLQLESLRSEGGTETRVEPLRITYPTEDVEPMRFTMAEHDFHLRVLKVFRKYESESESDKEVMSINFDKIVAKKLRVLCQSGNTTPSSFVNAHIRKLVLDEIEWAREMAKYYCGEMHKWKMECEHLERRKHD